MEMEGSTKRIPIINIRHLTEKYINGNGCVEHLHDDPNIKSILTKMSDAFTEWGFVHLLDHGIETDDMFKTSKEFFEKEKKIKSQFIRICNSDNWGYVPYKLETFDKNMPFDLKECFNFPHYPPDEKNKELSEFFKVGSRFSHNCHVLTDMLLRVLNPSLHSNDKDFLLTRHQGIGNKQLNETTVRLLYYPSIEHKEDILDKQLRCGEHSDYGTITLLFQDDAGGLQVVSPTGEYVDVLPVPGSIVINIGDLMEVWTSGRFKSTKHRVLIENRHKIARQSIAYFVHPDNDVEVSCIDGSEKFQTVNSYKYLMKKFSDTYD